jgi:hypothetical protein
MACTRHQASWKRSVPRPSSLSFSCECLFALSEAGFHRVPSPISVVEARHLDAFKQYGTVCPVAKANAVGCSAICAH